MPVDTLMQIMISYEQNGNEIINCRLGERKSLDGLNTIIYEPIHSDDTVIWVAIMSVIVIPWKGFNLKFM